MAKLGHLNPLKPNSWTYNFVEASGHNLERTQTWGFRIQCFQKKPFLLQGGGSFSTGDCEYQRGKLFRILSKLRPRIRPLVPKCCTLRKVDKGMFYLWRRFEVLRESKTRIILALGTKIWFFKTNSLVLVNLDRKVPLQVNFLDNDIWHCFISV